MTFHEQTTPNNQRQVTENILGNVVGRTFHQKRQSNKNQLRSSPSDAARNVRVKAFLNERGGPTKNSATNLNSVDSDYNYNTISPQSSGLDILPREDPTFKPQTRVE